MAIVRLHRAVVKVLQRRRSIIVVVAIAAVATFGCAASATPEAPSDDALLVEGRDIYIRNCVSCHGGAGGGGTGSKLNEGRAVERYPDPADQIAIVTDGRKAMPSFEAKLSAAEIEAVVRFTREVLSAED